MNEILNLIWITLFPLLELRGSIPYGILKSGLSWPVVFVVCVIANILVIPITFFILDYFHKHLVKIKIYKKIIEGSIERGRKQIEQRIGTKWEFIALALFVGVQLPMTGAYSGTLIAWFFKLNRRKSYIALSLGVLIAGIAVMLITMTGAEAFRFLIKLI